MAAPKDESYWRDADGSVNEEGHALGEVFEKKGKNFIKALNEDGYCTICYAPKAKPPVMRELKQIAETTKQKLAVWVCPVCDGDAHDIALGQAH